MDKIKKENIVKDFKHINMGMAIILDKLKEEDFSEVEKFLNIISYTFNGIRNELELPDELSLNQKKQNQKIKKANEKIRELEYKLGEINDLESAVFKISSFQEELYNKFSFLGFVKNITIYQKVIKVDFYISIKTGGLLKSFANNEDEMNELLEKENQNNKIINENFKYEESELIYNDFNKVALEKFFKENLEYSIVSFKVSPAKYNIDRVDSISFCINFNNISLTF